MLENDGELHTFREVDETEELPKGTKKPKTPINWKSEIKKRIFILSWIQNYNRDDAIGDAIAGITMGLTIIPQAIAYAALANLPSQYGLYSAFMGMLLIKNMESQN